jgi:nuclear pore complex protein Nup205
VFDLFVSQSEMSGQLKEEILCLLQQCLNFPAPTLAHFLLGYNINKPLRHTILQHPGKLALISNNG